MVSFDTQEASIKMQKMRLLTADIVISYQASAAEFKSRKGSIDNGQPCFTTGCSSSEQQLEQKLSWTTISSPKQKLSSTSRSSYLVQLLPPICQLLKNWIVSSTAKDMCTN